jgi:hypothetical protein
MLIPTLSEAIPFQGPIALERALFCLDCEVIFTGLTNCPSCSGSSVWPLAPWLSPAQSHRPVRSRLVNSPPRSDRVREAIRVVA